MKKYPIGIQDFRKLREGGHLYVDKTESIFHLITEGQYYFLSRPRRFGKSLLVSTLKCLFLGERELFDGLWVANRYDFEPHPVLHFSFSALGYKDIGLERGLHQALNNKAEEAGFSLTQEGIGPRFQELIKRLAENGQKVVLLIDEYDKPLVDYIDQQEQAAVNRDILKNFFSVIKDADPFLRFFLITGVSKFSKVSLFSDLNHLQDITLVERFESIAGYTQKELETSFESDIEQLAQKIGKSTTALREDIRVWYNGYSWGTETRLYNPFSILNLFSAQRFANYWWETGTPTFLIKKLRTEFQYNLNDLVAGQVMFESFTINDLNWLALLFQTGYLTIRDYDPETGLYTLGYPNREVRDTMQQHLLAAFRETTKTDSLPLLVNIKTALEQGDLERLIELTDILFSTIPHQIFQEKQEAFFHAILHLSFSGIGLFVQSEVSTAKGRVDTVVHTKDCIYVMEFKLDGSAQSALEQIREKRYGSPFLDRGKEVIALGVSFSSVERAVAEWEAIAYLSLLGLLE
ncbi:MAG: AAA family ATPase [Phaeodactylibacter xiamenensis]|uniref:AAA-ATPase-like domain-containing protein n=1 Tax=Phaeodactylibacter xiamenensis TaxID=1524460 RepID=A0A098S7C7_9BACT|nr:ATP-binding protein [Phaeodactylibacter xiamenensis]KGE86997.1 hypothetical protein IX84_18370 [Phaeodactylibacter xiamenensis]MCR9053193.1 ATP-binding protein [bacterium]